ncbi:MAG: hypothetical protein ACLU6Y_06595, partial [Ruminococcus sp.]
STETSNRPQRHQQQKCSSCSTGSYSNTSCRGNCNPTPKSSPSETPTPTEAPKTSSDTKTVVVITATAPEDANLQQDAEIKADYIAPGTDRYNAAVAAFNSQLSSQLGLDAENTKLSTYFTMYIS